MVTDDRDDPVIEVRGLINRFGAQVVHDGRAAILSFRSQGDHLFLTEVFGPDDFPPPSSAPVAAAVAALDAARAALLESAVA